MHMQLCTLVAKQEKELNISKWNTAQRCGRVAKQLENVEEGCLQQHDKDTFICTQVQLEKA